MDEMSTIRSAANAALKRVRAVAAGAEAGLLLLEGDRLIEEARRRGLAFELLLVAASRADRARAAAADGLPLRWVQDELLARVSRLETSPGSLALVRQPPERSPEELAAGPRSLLAVAAGLSDPGNLGALARCAEAAGAEALAVATGGCSPWNEKALRGSMGSLLRLPVIATLAAEELGAGLARRGYRQARADTRDGTDLAAFDWSGPLAIWFGSETGALPAVAASFEGVSIPMAGEVESLNVSAAAAVLLFAAGRNRGGGP